MTTKPARHRKYSKGAIIEKLVALTILVVVLSAIAGIACNISASTDPNAIGLPP
jgi:hypothetical protein